MEAWVWCRGLGLLYFPPRHGRGGWWGSVCYIPVMCVVGRFPESLWHLPGTGQDPCREPRVGHRGKQTVTRVWDTAALLSALSPFRVGQAVAWGVTRGLGEDCRWGSGSCVTGWALVVKGRQYHLWDQLSWAAAALLSPATLALASIIFC